MLKDIFHVVIKAVQLSQFQFDDMCSIQKDF